MPRIANTTDFTVPVEGVGSFTFGRRKMNDQILIHQELSAIYGGVHPTQWLETVGPMIATLKVMTVLAPKAWDIDELDPLDDATYIKLRRVFEALRDQENSFRAGAGVAGEGNGAPAV